MWKEKEMLLKLSSKSDLKEFKGPKYTKKSSVFNFSPQLGMRERKGLSYLLCEVRKNLKVEITRKKNSISNFNPQFGIKGKKYDTA